MTSQIQIRGDMGKLSAILQMPENETDKKYPIVIIMHGLMLKKEFHLLESLADNLLSLNIGSIRFDFNGHGESEGDFINMTIPNEIDDARNIYNYICDLKNIGDVSFLGHSQGGVVAAMLAGELGAEKIKSLVLMAPAAIYKDQAQNGNTLGINFDPGNIPEYITAFNHKIGRDYLKTAQDLPIYDMSEKYTGPVCIIQGKKDENVPFSEAESFCKIYKNCHLHLLDDENHFFKINPDKAINIAVDFLKDTI